MTVRRLLSAPWDRAALAISFAIIVMALVVVAGWHAHVRAAVQIFHGLIPMQYNTALCFLALGVAGIGVVDTATDADGGRRGLRPLMGAR